MEQHFCQKYSWIPTRAKQKTDHRHNDCDVLRTCREKTRSRDPSPEKPSLQECVTLLHQFLAGCGCAWNSPRTCGCREPSMRDVCSPEMLLYTVFQLLGSRSPFQLFSDLFCQLEMMHCRQKLVTKGPWLQDLLEGHHAAWMPAPHKMCLSCREHQAAELEDWGPVGKSQKRHHSCTPGRRPQDPRRDLPAVYECLYNMNQAGSKDLTKKDVRIDQRPTQGHLASIRELKNSLKTDLEKHQLYLTDIETRLSGLERRAEDVTRYLEKANLELEDIKHGSVSLMMLVDQQTSSPVRDDDLEELRQWDLPVLDSLWEQWEWSRAALRTRRSRCEVTRRPPQTGPRRREDPSLGPDRGHPAAGGSSGHWSDLQTGISLCQDQVNALIQKITRQMNQTE